jgi:UPF0716 protein FxsA
LRFAFLLFIIVPLLEMLLLFEVAEQLGGFTTLGLVVLTAIIGVQILKQQGLSTLLRANQRLESGQLPAQEIIEGMLLAGAGALLLTPGFVTDTLGFIFLAGPLRRPLARRIIKSGVVHSMGAGHGFHASWSSTNGAAGSRRSGSGSGNVYEGEYADDSREQLDDQDGSAERPDRFH